MVVLLRGRRKAMELPKTVLEISFEKTKAIRDVALRLVVVEVRSVQWKELERMELRKLWLGMANWPSSRCSADPAGTRHGRGPRHGDAGQQPVPDGDDENRSLDNSDSKSSTDRSEAGARRAYETARRMLTMVARQRMEETTKEMEQANAAVENAKRKVGPATGMASDVATLLDMLKPHLSTLSVNAADLVARIEGDMKVAKTDEENIKKEMKNEVPGETQPTQLDKPVSDAQEINSQLQAMEAMRMAEEEDEERLRRAKIEAGKYASTTSPTLAEKPQQCSQQHQRAEAGGSDDHDCTIVLIYLPCESGGQRNGDHDRQGSHRGGPGWCDGNSQTGDWVRLVRIGRDDEDQYSQGGTRPLQAVLNHEKRVEAKKGGRRLLRGSKARNRLVPERQEKGRRKPREFDSSLGYPGEGPQRVQDFGIYEKCFECDLVPWRVSRGGDPGKCEKCKKCEKKRD